MTSQCKWPISVNIFCLISICSSLSDEANKTKSLNIEISENLSPMCRKCSEKFSLKNPKIYKECMNSLTFWYPAVPQFLIAAIFLVDCKGVKLAKITQINQLFSFLNLICIYGHIFYGLTRTIMSKNVNNDVTMNPPIKALHFLGE